MDQVPTASKADFCYRVSRLSRLKFSEARAEDQRHADGKRRRGQAARERRGELAALAPLDGEKFASAYIETMIKGHTEVLGMIDNQLLKNAANAELKKHLTETRGHVANHLEAAKKL